MAEKMINVDGAYVLSLTKKVEDLLSPIRTFAITKDREELSQVMALIVLVNKRFDEMNLSPQQRVSCAQASAAIMRHSA